MRTTCFACFVLILTLLSGCATNPAISAGKAGIKTVQLEPRVDARQGMRYGLDLSRGAGLANALASMITDSVGQKGIARMSAVMSANQINVAEMVRERVEKKLQNHPDLQVTTAPADGVFLISITQYGFARVTLATAKKGPFLLLHAELRDRKGKRVWDNENVAIQLTEEGIGATWDEYEAQPEKLRADWARQIDNLVEKLIPTSK